jgi:hypothetical protein
MTVIRKIRTLIITDHKTNKKLNSNLKWVISNSQVLSMAISLLTLERRFRTFMLILTRLLMILIAMPMDPIVGIKSM